MSFSLSNLFYPTQKTPRNEVDRVFEYMAATTRHKDSAKKYLKEFKKLKKKEGRDGQKIYIKLYLSWEEYLVNDGISLSEKTTKEIFRKHVAGNVNIEKLDTRFGLIFFPERERILIVYELVIEQLIISVIKEIGLDATIKIFAEITPGTIFSGLSFSKNKILFEKVTIKLMNRTIEYPVQKINKIFKVFITNLFNKIEVSLGEKVVADLFKKMYEEFHQTYNAEFALQLLKVIPEKILSLDDWLYLLSKSELEKQIKEQTQELESLNEGLEKKVEERTAELQKAYDDLKELDKKKTDFISVATHQIRTPVSAMKWILNMLQKEDSSNIRPEQRDLLKKADKANERLSFIINDILDTDMLTSGRAIYNFQLIDMVTTANNAIENLSTLAQSKNIKLTLKELEENCCEVVADTDRLQAVIENLLDNAIRYSSKNSEVIVSMEMEPEHLIIKVSDQGIGIPEDQKSDIFQRFFRAKNGIRAHANGTGLGLFIAKTIVEGHNGTITFESFENKGATFIIKIPFQQK